MLGFKKFINAQVGQHRTEDHAVLNQLLQRVGESLVVEDRREALMALSNVLTDDPSAQSAFASVGFSTICLAMQMDRDDPTVVRTGLECIALAVAAEQSGRDQQSARAAAVNAEQFARTDGAIPLLLSLLEVRSLGTADALHVRFTILQILHSLLDANTLFAQQAILRVPTGVSQLVEMVGESEVMRNEALLILQRLVAGNPDAQKVAVFSGCLDKIFSVLKEEEYMGGSIVVVDCLQLANSLLRGNTSNQRMYVELGYEKVLHQVLQQESQALVAGGVELSQERCNNIATALDVLEACIGDGAVERNGSLPALETFAVWATSPPWVRAAAWRCLAATAQINSTTRHAMAERVVEVAKGHKVMLVQAALHECFASPVITGRQAAGDFFASVATPNIQSTTLKGLLAAPDAGSALQALYLQPTLPDILTTSQAAAALAPLVVNNKVTKQEMLAGQSPQQQGGILDACAQRLAISVTKFGAQPQGQELVANFGTLLIAWLPACPAAVQQFLQSISKTPFLVGVVMTENQFGAGTAIIRGICAVLLGMCCIYAPAQSAVDPKVLLKAVIDQIGLNRYEKVMDTFVVALNAIASRSPQSTAPTWSPNAASWLAAVVSEVQRDVKSLATGVNPYPLPPPQTQPPQVPKPEAMLPPPPAVPQYNNNAQPKPESPKPSIGPAPTKHVPLIPTAPLVPPQNHMMSELDLNTVKALKIEVDQLKQRNVQLEKEAKEAKADMERMQQALAKAEADLEGLSTAYTALDSHANELQAKLDQAIVTGPAANGQPQDMEALLQAAREEAERDANAAMEDLLVCLGQEEAKVERLEALLEEARAAAGR